MRSFVVSHPHAAAFSVGVARAFAHEQRLSRFITGVAFGADDWTGRLGSVVAGGRPILRNRILADFPSERLQSLGLVELAARLFARALKKPGAPARSYNAVFAAHDAAVSLIPWPREATAVYAYEDAALQTFRRARRRIFAIASGTSRSRITRRSRRSGAQSARVGPTRSLAPCPVEPAWKKQRKDDELALATTVSVASAFTKAFARSSRAPGSRSS